MQSDFARSRPIPPPVLGPLLFALAGCANPGQPKPPSLHLPAPATALRAERIGPVVHLTWQTPADSTDGQGLRGSLTAVLCRDTLVPARGSAECRRVAALPVNPGPSQADDPLPQALQSGPAGLLVYRVQLLNSQGRGAPATAVAYSASGAAPAALGPLAVTASRQGAEVTWSPTQDAAPVELRRTLVQAGPQSRSPASAGNRSSATQAGPAKAPPAVVTLRAEPGVAAAGHDPGGLLDPGVQPQSTYSYTAQRVRTSTLPLPGAAGGTVSVELRGSASPPVSFVYRDVFPPKPPAGLVTIGSPGDPAGLPPSIDLSWEPGLEPDLLGYNVYRADSDGASFTRLNRTPLPGPAYHDTSVRAEVSYKYRVTAIDRSGNESQPSATAMQTVPRP